jgi:predicted DNA-binding transcriptional regulator AlpA
MTAPEILNERQVQEIYGFSIPYLRRTRHERRGPRFLKIGKLVRYRRSDIETYLAEHTVETTGASKRVTGQKRWLEQ